MEFELTEEQKRFQQSAREYLKRELNPIVADLENNGEFPIELFRKLGQDGLLGINVPREYGGLGGDTTTCCILMEEVSQICGGIAACILTSTLASPLAILAAGSEKQKQRYVRSLARGEKIIALCFTEPDAGSDNLNIQTTAEKNGDYYLINGNKIFVTNGAIGDVHLVVAITSRSKGPAGLSMFLLEGRPPELKISTKMEKLGWRTSETVEVAIKDLRVHKDQMLGGEGIGLENTLHMLNFGRIMMAASALGIALGAYNECVQFCEQRFVNGKAFIKQQAIRHQLVNMYIDVEMIRLMIYKTAWMRDQGMRHRKESSIVKYRAGELAKRITREAIQLIGKDAFLNHDSNISRHFRDAPIYTIGDGTSEIQQEIISRELGFVDKSEMRT